MRNVIVRFTAIAVLVAASLPVAAQQAPSVTPEAKAIVDRHVAAVGAKSLGSVKSMRASGALSMPAQGITGTVEISAARPNKTLLKAEIAGIGKLESAFDGERGWSVDPIMGPSLLTGKQLDQARFDAVFDSTFLDLTRYASLTAAGTATFDGRKMHRLDAVNTLGDKSTEYFDAETGLHAGSISTRETPMGTVEVTSIIRDYRKVGTSMQAHQMVQKMMGVEQVITLEKFEFNTVPADAFAMPPAVKALIK
jgi:outer membrane lipoprotein-sorting protein